MKTIYVLLAFLWGANALMAQELFQCQHPNPTTEILKTMNQLQNNAQKSINGIQQNTLTFGSLNRFKIILLLIQTIP